MADQEVQRRLERFQIRDLSVDLSQLRRSSYGIYSYNLHLVFVHEARYMEVREDRLALVHEMLLRASGKHNRLMSRASIFPDHVHLTIGCNVAESPAEVVVGYMNNLAYALGMKAVFRFSYYAGTIGEFDRGAISGRG